MDTWRIVIYRVFTQLQHVKTKSGTHSVTATGRDTDQSITIDFFLSHSIDRAPLICLHYMMSLSDYMCN